MSCSSGGSSSTARRTSHTSYTASADSGDVVSAAFKKIVGALEDPAGAKVKSENLLEIDFVDGQPIR